MKLLRHWSNGRDGPEYRAIAVYRSGGRLLLEARNHTGSRWLWCQDTAAAEHAVAVLTEDEPGWRETQF